MLLILFIHVTDTERNITLKFGNAFTRNTEFICSLITLELRPAQQLHW